MLASYRFKKRNKGAVAPEIPPCTHFILEGLSAKMEKYVDCVRDIQPKIPKAKKVRKTTVLAVPDEGDMEIPGNEEDGYEHPSLKLPRSILDRCEASLKAADERQEKVSTYS
ncbi:hypothetical protein B0H13DRAFT_2336062 [Mycena leptocephala]|nr:hypothetical protein B0H13DRAFT_2336062 [Mycena leptocephala]